MFRSAALILCALLAPLSGYAHPEIEAALTRLNAAIATAPRDAALYLDRGLLYAKHQDWLSAEANYTLASELSPNLPHLARVRGELALLQRDAAEALRHLDRALAQDPRDAEALIFRSGARAALGAKAAAARDLDAALALIAEPRPELFLLRASFAPTPAEALAVLDGAIARIGEAHTLQLRALEIEETSGRFDAALARLGAMLEPAERKETFLKRRGDILTRAGRATEAREAYAAALAAIDALPDWLRASPDTQRLARELASLTSAASATLPTRS